MTATDILDGKARIEDQNAIRREEENYVWEWPNFDCTPLLFSFSFPPLSLARSHQPNDSAPVVAFPERRAPRGRLTTRSRARLGWTNADVTVPSRTVYANNSARDRASHSFALNERNTVAKCSTCRKKRERERRHERRTKFCNTVLKPLLLSPSIVLVRFCFGEEKKRWSPRDTRRILVFLPSTIMGINGSRG